MLKIFTKINAWLHLWLGIVTGIIVIILSITGCILTFKEEINHWTQSWRRTEARSIPYATPSAIVRAVEQALPPHTVSSIWYHGFKKTAVVTIDADSNVFVNPYTAEVVAVKQHDEFFEFIEEGHYHLWLPDEIAHYVVGISMIIFLFLLISGVILWWPKRWNKSNINKSFKIKWKARFKRLNYDLHNVLGFYSLLIAVLIAFTALIMCYPWFADTVHRLAGGEVSARVRSLSDSTLHTAQHIRLQQVDRAWQFGLDSLAQFNKDAIIVRIPQQETDPIYLCVDMYRGNWRDVYLDQYNLKLLDGSNARVQDLTFAQWLGKNNYALHTGYILGLPTKIIYFLVSLVCASLPITGFYIWWGRRKKSKK